MHVQGKSPSAAGWTTTITSTLATHQDLATYYAECGANAVPDPRPAGTALDGLPKHPHRVDTPTALGLTEQPCLSTGQLTFTHSFIINCRERLTDRAALDRPILTPEPSAHSSDDNTGNDAESSFSA